MQILNQKAHDYVGKGKAALILEQPFFASLLCNMEFFQSDKIQTLATNGDYIKYNPDFVLGLTLDQLRFALCHEVGHAMFQHMFRKGSRNHRNWNIAGDYIINDLLVREKVGQIKPEWLQNPQLVQAGGGTTEGVYDLLPPPQDDQQGGEGGIGSVGDHGDPMDECEDATGSDAEKTEAEARMKVKVAQAAQAAKMCGKMSADLERFVQSALKPKVNWADQLRRFFSAKAKVDYSYARPKRRFVWDDLYLPSLSGEKLGKVVVAVDCSGSIGQAELDAFAAEIKAIKEDTIPEQMDVLYFDTRISNHETFGPDDEFTVNTGGAGGGTAFSPIFRYTEKMDLDPVCLVVLTDLECSDFGPAPAYPVMWITTHSTRAPWGEVVPMKNKM